MYNLKTVDKYSISLIQAFEKEHRRYLSYITTEESTRFLLLNHNPVEYFDKTDIFSQKTIDNAFKVRFFSSFGSHLSDMYHEYTLQGSSIDMRFTQMGKHIFRHRGDCTMDEIASKSRLESYNNVSDFRELKYLYWGSTLQKHLLFESLRIIERVKIQVDSQNNSNNNTGNFQVDSQNNSNNSSGDCFIVTATFGTPHAKEVIKYRNFRDQYLSNYLLGRRFIYLYNIWGPKLGIIVNKNPRLKGFMAKVLGTVSQVLPETKDYII
ncbi:MAG: CFI-box-CTERM domain-containing protein [Nostoc sp.]